MLRFKLQSKATIVLTAIALLALALGFAAPAQAPLVDQFQLAGGNGDDAGRGITTDSSGEVYATSGFSAAATFTPASSRKTAHQPC